jgi:uncharacterized membrane protein YgdD (TMEM256/DUF423 family)
MTRMNWGVVGALLGLLGVVAGAFGAHGLRGTVPAERLEVFETAVRYQMYHSLALLVAGMTGAGKAGWAFFSGTLVFSGSLYLLVLADAPRLGAVTPLGGVLLMVGWVLLLVEMARPGRRRPDNDRG